MYADSGDATIDVKKNLNSTSPSGIDDNLIMGDPASSIDGKDAADVNMIEQLDPLVPSIDRPIGIRS